MSRHFSHTCKCVSTFLLCLASSTFYSIIIISPTLKCLDLFCMYKLQSLVLGAVFKLCNRFPFWEGEPGDRGYKNFLNSIKSTLSLLCSFNLHIKLLIVGCSVSLSSMFFFSIAVFSIALHERTRALSYAYTQIFTCFGALRSSPEKGPGTLNT